MLRLLVHLHVLVLPKRDCGTFPFAFHPARLQGVTGTGGTACFRASAGTGAALSASPWEPSTLREDRTGERFARGDNGESACAADKVAWPVHGNCMAIRVDAWLRNRVQRGCEFSGARVQGPAR